MTRHPRQLRWVVSRLVCTLQRQATRHAADQASLRSHVQQRAGASSPLLCSQHALSNPWRHHIAGCPPAWPVLQQQQHRGVSSASSSDSSAAADTASSSSSSSGGRQGKDMAIVFTCAKCDTRSLKAFSRQSYERGLVLVRCPGCSAMHLIADNLGWFEDGGFKIEQHLAARGQPVKRVRLDGQQQRQQQQQQQQQQQRLTAEDMVGWSRVQQLLSTVAPAAGASEQQQHTSGCRGEAGGNGGACSSDASSAGTAPVAAADGAPNATALPADGDVVQVAPEDVDAWARVQQRTQA